MDRAPERSRQTVLYILCLLLIAAVVSRMLPHYRGTPSQVGVTALLAAYVVLFATERPATRRLGVGYLHGYLAAQSAFALALVFAFPRRDAPLDYFATLFLPLCMQAAWHLGDRAARTWVVVLAAEAAGSMLGYYLVYEGSWDGVPFALVYVAGCLLVAGFSAVTKHAEEARRESQALLDELQAAHRRLEEYAAQVEELAAAHERSRLARELHDSVSQTLFSMTLTAEATRLLLDRDPSRVGAQLDRLQSLARDALAEMRSLILQRPSRSAPGGLAAALCAHAEERLARDGLAVQVRVEGEGALPGKVEQELYSIVQEALNNVVKHAGVDRAVVTISLSPESYSLCVADEGAGFEPARASASPHHLGLSGMAERARALGATLRVDSAPGAGTRVHVEGRLEPEGHHV